MMTISENNEMKRIGLVIPTPGLRYEILQETQGFLYIVLSYPRTYAKYSVRVEYPVQISQK